jgi:biotin carboxylase
MEGGFWRLVQRKSYILSLGAGKNQIPFLEACNRAGFRTIAVDKDPKAPGFSISDLKVIESITEYRKIYAILLRTLLDSPILGVGCRSFGKATMAASYLAEKLGLLSSPLEVIKKFYHKYNLKELLSQNNVPIPKQFILNSKKKDFDLLGLKYPLIAKPVRGESKQGIFLIHSSKELLSWKKKFKEEYAFEEFITGKEFTVLGFAQNGKFHLISVSDKVTTDYPPFLEIAHVLPCSQPDIIGEIRFQCQRIVSVTGLVNSPLVAEFKMDSKKNIFLIEVVPEIGGEFLADWIIPKHYEYNYFDDYVRLITGQDLKLFNKNKKQKHETWIRYLASPPGKYRILEYKNIDSPEKIDIFYDRIFYPEGMEIDTASGNSSRMRVFGFIKSPSLSREFFSPQKTFHVEAELEPID